MNDETVEIEDDIILDVFDIMSQSYLNIDEEEIEEDIILVRICGLIIYWVIYYIRETKIRDMRLRFNIPLGRETNDTQRGKMIDLDYHCFNTINVPPPGRSESAKRCIRNIQHC